MDSELPLANLLHVTDTHLFADPEARLLGVNTYASARAVLEQALSTGRPDLLINTGDIAQEATVTTYLAFRALLEEYFEGEILTVPGNHDLSAPMLAAELTIGRADFGIWSVIGVDTHGDGQVAGRLEDAEFERLEKELDATDAAHVLLVGHHPPVPIGAPWLDAQRIANGDRLLDWMRSQGRIRGYLFGHVHQAFDQHQGALRILGTPSTCFQFKPASETFALDDRLPGYRTLALMPRGEIQSQVRRLSNYDLEINAVEDRY